MKRFDSFALMVLATAIVPSAVEAQPHPRTIVQAADLEALRARTDIGLAAAYKEGLLAYADSTLTAPLPVEVGAIRDESWPASIYALAYLLTDNETYAARALDWLLHFSESIDDWNGTYINGGQAYQVINLAFTYDWIYNYPLFTAEDKAVVQARLEAEAALAFSYSGSRHTSALGVGIAGYALRGETALANELISQAVAWYTRFGQQAATDGVWASGPAYGSSQASYTAWFLTAAKSNGTDLFGLPFYASQKAAQLYLRVPTKDRYSSFPHGDVWDSPMMGSELDDDGKYQGFLFAYAAGLQDPHLQWQALDDFDTQPIVSILGLLTYDPTLEPSPPSELPLSHYFDDSEVFVSRSSWEESGTHLYFKCGPLTSHSMARINYNVPSYSNHAHPSAGNFMIFSRGDWLATEDRYMVPKTLETHNTLLIDSNGQLGDGENWPNVYPQTDWVLIGATLTNDRLAYAVGDFTYAYAAPIQRVQRHILHLLPDLVVVADDLADDTLHTYTWVLNQDPWHTITELAPLSYRVRGSRAEMSVQLVEPDPAAAVASVADHDWHVPPPNDGAASVAASHLRVSPPATASARFLAVLNPRGIGDPALDVQPFRTAELAGAEIDSVYTVIVPTSPEPLPYAWQDLKSDSRLLFTQNDAGLVQYLAGAATHFVYQETFGFRSSKPTVLAWSGTEGQLEALEPLELTLLAPRIAGVSVDGVAVTPISQEPGALTVAIGAGHHTVAITVARDFCNPNPCLNGGTCNGTDDAFACMCPPGFEGDACETAVAARDRGGEGTEPRSDGCSCDASSGSGAGNAPWLALLVLFAGATGLGRR